MRHACAILSGWLRASTIRRETIRPVEPPGTIHGSSHQLIDTRREDLRWHIGYLSAVKQNVQSAIDEGLALEQTAERVTMPEFAGYVLFGWVHPSLNVPAAYQDLSAARSAASDRTR